MFNFNDKLLSLASKAQDDIKSEFEKIDSMTEYNQRKMLSAFIDNGVSSAMFAESTGYGHDDKGRDTLDKVFAQAVGAQDAIVRHNFTCGTHTLATALFGVLRPGDTMLCVSGTPYDTIKPVIGITENGENQGSLKDFGIKYRQVELLENGRLDFEAIAKAVKETDVKMVYIQRSRGYSLRPTVTLDEINRVVKLTKANSKAIVMVDNCYGEWTREIEPVAVGADLIAGSLIKNAGGGIAKTGGYIAGRSDLVEKCSYRMSTPGIGRDIGATLGENRNLFMGIFNSPHVVGEAMKTACFTAKLFELLGFDVTPTPHEERYDIIQAIKLGGRENLIAFCKGVQKGAPVDSFVTPEPSVTPGYDCEIIMAAGTFTQGASIEVSADAPLREPFAVWFQGGLNYHSAKISVLSGVQELLNNNLINI